MCNPDNHDYFIKDSYSMGNVQIKIVLVCRKCGDVNIKMPEHHPASTKEAEK